MEKDVFDPELELIQIAYSPYCEVIRWALDEKGLSAKQSYYLPGMQAEGTCQDNDVAFLPRLRIDDHYLHCPESIIQLIELFRGLMVSGSRRIRTPALPELLRDGLTAH